MAPYVARPCIEIRIQVIWWDDVAMTGALLIPSPLQSERDVVTRGWLAIDSPQRPAIVQVSGERSEAGVGLASASDLAPGIRYDIVGRLNQGILTPTHVSLSASQARPEIDEPRARALGLAANIPINTWKRLTATWRDSPLDELAVSGWGTFPADTDGLSLRTILGEVVTIRWVTPELYAWMTNEPPQHSLRILPLVANAWEDLIPW